MAQPEGEGAVADALAWGHLTEENHERLTQILRAHIPEVFRNTRVIEEQTGYSSEIGKNMMVDVLAHLSTLAIRTDLGATGQASQIAKIEEHLCRAIVEHPEEVVRNRTGELNGRWQEYQREVVPLRAEGELRGIPRQQELDELRTRIKSHLETARKQKPDENTWEESLNAAAAATEAAHLSSELADKLEQCIGAAADLRARRARDARTRRQWLGGIAVTIVVAVLAFVGGLAYDRSSDPQSSVAEPTGSAGPR